LTYRFLPDVALADVAFEAESGHRSRPVRVLRDGHDRHNGWTPKTLKGLGRQGVLSRLRGPRPAPLRLPDRAHHLEGRRLPLVQGVLREGRRRRGSLKAKAKGEPIDRERHGLRNDVKAVTMHMFGVKHEGARWRATVVLDI